MKKKKKKYKARDEVLLLHLLKTFNCGYHKNKKKDNEGRKSKYKEEIEY